ncbi:hypothetical protein [Blautia luti]
MKLNHLDGTQADLHAPCISHTQPEGMVHKNGTIEATRDYRM